MDKGSPDSLDFPGQILEGIPHIGPATCQRLSIVFGIHRCMSPGKGWSVDVRNGKPPSTGVAG
eukprot:7017574-Ditylum_brightwellii.AAC.1